MEFLQSPPQKNVDFFQKLVGAWISDDHDGRYKIGWYEDTLSFMELENDDFGKFPKAFVYLLNF